MIIDGGAVGIGLESTIVDFTEEIPVVLRPGYISLEMLQEILGEVRMDKGLLKSDSGVHPKAPGMKYRHYAPKAELSIVEVPWMRWWMPLTGLPLRRGQRAVHRDHCLRGDQRPVSERHCEMYWKPGRGRGIARHLYQVLREFDDCQVSAIYSEAFLRRAWELPL